MSILYAQRHRLALWNVKKTYLITTDVNYQKLFKGIEVFSSLSKNFRIILNLQRPVQIP